jgi:CHAT domain-containing protein
VLLAGAAFCGGGDQRSAGHRIRSPAFSSDSLLAAGESLFTADKFDSARAVWTLALRSMRAAHDTRGEARALTWLGLAAWRLGDLKVAQGLGEEALAIKQRLGMSRELSRSYHALGLAALDADHNEAATRLFQQALEAARKTGDARGVARAQGGLGLAYGYLGDLRRAREGHRQEREAARAIADLRLEANGLANEAMVDIWEGNARPAIARLDTARDLYRRSGYAVGEENALGQLGTAYELTGQEELALTALDSALAIARRLGLKEQVADLQRLIGGVHLRIGDYRRALRSYGEAEGTMRAAGLTANLGALLRSSADAQLRLGNLPRADASMREALRLHTSSGERLDLLDDLLLLAEIDYRATGLAGAEARLKESRTIADRLNTRGSRVAVVLAEAHFADLARDSRRVLRVLHTAGPDLAAGDYGAQWLAGALAARAHARLGALDSAVASGRRAVAAVERLRGALASEALRSTFVADRADVYGDLVLILLRLGRAEEAFALADAARSRGLLDHLTAARGDTASGAISPEITGGERLLLRIDELIQRLRETERRQPRERGPSADSASAPLAAELAAARSAYEALLVRAVQRDPRATAILGTRSVRLAEVRAALRPDEALLEYFLSSERLVVFAVTRAGMRVVQSGLTPDALTQRVRLLRDLWGAPTVEWESGVAASQALDHTLLAPLRDAGLLAGIRRLIIVPHGILGQLPFAALQDERTGRFLAQDYAIIHLPSAAALAVLRERRALPTWWEARGEGFAPFPGASELPATARELEAFRASAPDRSARAGAEATEAAVRRALGREGVVHVATHGVLNVRSPLFSRIELARPRAPRPDDDGRLEAHELLGLTIRSGLVFFSGCETGAGQEWTDEPVRGTGDLTLAQAVLSAGAANVIMTLWRIDDAGAAEFAGQFYRNLRRMPLAEALAGAQRSMASDVRYRSPYYWAGYVLSGEGASGPGAQFGVAPSVPSTTGSPSLPAVPQRSKP